MGAWNPSRINAGGGVRSTTNTLYSECAVYSPVLIVFSRRGLQEKGRRQGKAAGGGGE